MVDGAGSDAEVPRGDRAARLAADQALRRATLVAETGRAFAEAGLEPNDILDALALRLTEVLGDGCVIWQTGADGHFLELVALRHREPTLRVAFAQALAGRPLDTDGAVGGGEGTGKAALLPVIDPELANEWASRLDGIAPAGLELRSLLSVPLRARGHVLGSLTLLRFGAAASYTTDDLTLVQELADRAALVLENARLYQTALADRHRAEAAQMAVERAASRLGRLQVLTEALAGASTVEEVAHLVVGEGVTAMGAEAGSLFLLDGAGEALERAGTSGYPEAPGRSAERYPVTSDAPIARAVRENQPIWLESQADWSRQAPAYAVSHAATGFEAAAAVPLLGPSGAAGVLALSFVGPRHFAAGDRALLLTFGRQAAQALERTRLLAAERAARAEAEDQRSRLRSLFTQAPAAIAVLREPAHRFEFVNPTLHGLLGARPLSGLTFAEALPELEAQGLGVLLDEVYREGKPYAGTEMAIRLIGADGRERERYFNVGMQPTRDADGATEGILVHAVEVTDQVIARQRLEAALRSRDAFLSIASHELKTPLTSLLGYAQVLQRRLARQGSLGASDENLLQGVADQARRLNRLIDALLDVSRIQGGRLEIERRPVDLARLALRLADEVRPTLDGHLIEVEAPLPGPIVLGDELRLEQVLLNLIGNAVKYSPGGGRVRLCVVGGATEATLLVGDEGIGVPESARERLFSRFYRAENAEERQIGGLGIGLFVVREIVTLHGGIVSLESVEGVGSTFIVHLPLAPDEQVDSGGADVGPGDDRPDG